MIKQQNHYQPPIKKGEIIRLQDKGIWNKARADNIAGTPESYVIT